MSWQGDSPSGAVLYPAGPETIPDFGWSSGAFGGGTAWTEIRRAHV